MYKGIDPWIVQVNKELKTLERVFNFNKYKVQELNLITVPTKLYKVKEILR